MSFWSENRVDRHWWRYSFLVYLSEFFVYCLTLLTTLYPLFPDYKIFLKNVYLFCFYLGSPVFYTTSVRRFHYVFLSKL